MKKLVVLTGIFIGGFSHAYALDNFTAKRRALALSIQTEVTEIVVNLNKLQAQKLELAEAGVNGAGGFQDVDFSTATASFISIDPNLNQLNSYIMNLFVNVVAPAIYSNVNSTAPNGDSRTYLQIMNTIKK